MSVRKLHFLTSSSPPPPQSKDGRRRKLVCLFLSFLPLGVGGG